MQHRRLALYPAAPVVEPGRGRAFTVLSLSDRQKKSEPKFRLFFEMMAVRGGFEPAFISS